MKITIYTISDCYFSKQEKDYLSSHNLPYEEKNLEENREFLTEMLTISNNFAGTPVTKIEKDDGSIVVLKGFTKDEFNQTLNIVDPAPQPEMASVADAQATMPTPSLNREPVAPVMPVPAPVVPQAMPQVSAPPAPVMPPAPQAPSPPQPDMASIAAQIEQLKKLQESLAQQTSNVQVAPPQAPPAYVPPPQPVAPVAPSPMPVAPAPVSQPAVASAPAAPAPAASVDDSLAAILAELQAKINSSQSSGGTTGTPQQS